MITALQSLPVHLPFGVAALARLAQLQGRRVDAWRDEQPGRISHGLRHDDLTTLGKLFFSPYYGTVDASLLYVILLHAVYCWTLDRSLLQRLFAAAAAALSWAIHDGDIDGDGVQDYYYDAPRRKACIARLLGKDAEAAAYAGRAAGYVMALGAFWLEAVFGFVRLDLGMTGMRYVGGEKPGFWIIGMLFHMVDSILIGLAYAAFAWPILPRLGIPVGTIGGDVVGGTLYAVVVWLLLAMLIAMPMMGEGVFGYQTKSAQLALQSLGLHLLFGTAG